MKLNFLQKQTSRREMLRGSATLAGSAFLAHLFPATLLRASAARYAEQAPSPPTCSRACAPSSTPFHGNAKLADNVTMFDVPAEAW